jgi:hypothetical protein
LSADAYLAELRGMSPADLAAEALGKLRAVSTAGHTQRLRLALHKVASVYAERGQSAVYAELVRQVNDEAAERRRRQAEDLERFRDSIPRKAT